MELETSALVNIKIICNSLLTILTISAIFFYFLLKTLLIIDGFYLPKILIKRNMLENPGIDPGTSRMRSGRSTI